MTEPPKTQTTKARDRLQVALGVLFFTIMGAGLAVAIPWWTLMVTEINTRRALVEAEAAAQAIRVIGEAVREYPEGAAFVLEERGASE